MFMSCDKLGQRSELDTDICIVGAGPAGIALAREFIGTRHNVLLLESGSLEFDTATQDLSRGTIVNNVPFSPLHATRARLFGGTSALWLGSCGQLDEIDFQQRDWMPRSGWPIKKSDLTTYYQRANDFVGLGQVETDPEFWADDQRTVIQFADNNFVTAMRHRQPTRFGPAYEDPVEQSENIRVLLNANLTQINRSPDGRAVESVTASSLNGTRVSIRAKTFVLACGGVENARLLLANQFDKELDYVGRCFFFHARTVTGEFLLSNPEQMKRLELYSTWQMVNDKQVRFALRLNESVQAAEGIGNHAIFLRPGGAPADLLELSSLGNRFQGDQDWSGFTDDLFALIQRLDDIGEHYYDRVFGDDKAAPLLNTRISLDQIPNPDSRVTLNDEYDALGVPRCTLKWTYAETELRQLETMHELLARSLGAAALGRYRLLDSVRDPDAFIRGTQQGTGGGHQMGTTRMSASAADGVVDSDCKIHGIDNLYCAGSSVFPTGGWMNPTLTLIALSIRLADHLKAA